MSRYPTNRMYQVTTDFKATAPMDISAKKGDVVGIIKEHDPSGGDNKWYVDNGGESESMTSTLGLDGMRGGGEEAGPMDILAKKGDVCGIIKQHDSSGGD